MSRFVIGPVKRAGTSSHLEGARQGKVVATASRAPGDGQAFSNPAVLNRDPRHKSLAVVLSPLSRTVIHLAVHPAEQPLPAGTVARCWRWLFGHPAPKPLADPRLEALRQLAACVHAAPVKDVPSAVIERCLSNGWSNEDVVFVVTFIRGLAALQPVPSGRERSRIGASSPWLPKPRSRPVLMRDARA